MHFARWLLPALTLAVVLWLTWRDTGGAGGGPGPLHPAHAAAPALAGGAHCTACHAEGAGIDAEACSSCHPAIGEQLRQRRGLHGALPADDARRCGRCHGEHHGAAAPLLPAHAWLRAGVPEPKQYDHAHTAGFDLVGAHTRLACTACHPRGDAAEPPAGGRFLGADRRCTSCHEDVHRGNLGGDCAGCHGQERPWREAPGLRHDRFPLVDAHAGLACTQCHAEDGPHALARATRDGPVRACASCHTDPHGGAGPATALRLPQSAECVRCHATTRWDTARPDAERHAALGFPLLGDHATAACASCHGDAAQPQRWRAASPAPEACAACHDVPHAAALVAADLPGCGDCHRAADADFTAGRMTAARHEAAGMPLVAPHAEVACARCHTGASRTERYPGRRAEDCRACHEDPHAGQFAAADCTSCHAATHWTPHGFGLAAHANTRFPLEGAHEAVACQHCHPRDAAAPRRFVGTPTACDGCHVDVHRGAFVGRGQPATFAGRQGCARCHDTAAFAPVAAFDHALWTGHALQGAHAALVCAACHPPGAAGQRLGPAAGRTCSACHDDPHAGQFAVAGATDCARCHGETEFVRRDFDHAKTRFPLDATHAAVPCSRCHQTARIGDRDVVRYRPLGTSCGDCHRLQPGRDGR